MNFLPDQMPDVFKQLAPLGWNIADKYTYSENVFVSHYLKWYNYKILVFLTDSASDYRLAKSVINTKKFKELRKEVGADLHLNLLVHPVIFMVAEDLDTLYCNFDFDLGYTSIDFSHFDENDCLDSDFISEWKWLEADDKGDEWSEYQQQFITKLK